MKGHNYGLCRKCGKIHVHPKGMLNKHFTRTEETREKLREALTDKHLTEAHKANIAKATRTPKARKKNSDRLTKLWEDEEYRVKTVKSIKISHNTSEARAINSKAKLKYIAKNPKKARNDAIKGGKAARRALQKPPSDLECYVMAIIQKYELSIQYTGNANWEWRLGRYTPDFVVLNKDVAIDVFGDHFHNKLQEEKYREHYNKYQYEWHCLWEHEIYAMTEEQLYNWLKNKIGE